MSPFFIYNSPPPFHVRRPDSTFFAACDTPFPRLRSFCTETSRWSSNFLLYFLDPASGSTSPGAIVLPGPISPPPPLCHLLCKKLPFFFFFFLPPPRRPRKKLFFFPPRFHRRMNFPPCSRQISNSISVDQLSPFNDSPFLTTQSRKHFVSLSRRFCKSLLRFCPPDRDHLTCLLFFACGHPRIPPSHPPHTWFSLSPGD